MSKSSAYLTSGAHVAPVIIEDEMARSYLDYAMSVIVSRALPDVRDGLKPVQRRILYAMAEGGYSSDKPHRKSARAVGEVMGKYHPHGDSPIYQAMVRLGQTFSMSAVLIDSYGNFGSIDGDKPAAMRYTEARLHKLADHFLLKDYDKDVVDFEPNYDGSLAVPKVLPAVFPNLLVNGAGGIAVGMATNIPPHNLGEVVDVTCALVDNPDLSDEEFLKLLPGPDFPTGALLIAGQGVREAAASGRGSVIMRAKTHVEDLSKDRQSIVITEIPYQVQKARLLERIAYLVNSKELDGISDIRDESDRDGIRAVIELKKDVVADVVLNRLFSMTPLQTSFACNFLALDGGLQPKMMPPRAMVQAFLRFREEVVLRRTRFFLRRARIRAHLVLGLLVAVSHIDKIVALIKASKDPKEALEALTRMPWPRDDIAGYLKLLAEENLSVETSLEKGYLLSEAQAKGILELKLHRLTGLERSKLEDELKDLAATISDLMRLLSQRPLLLQTIKEELQEVKKAHAVPRRTEFIQDDGTQSIEDLIQREDMVVTFSVKGYIKRVPLDTYRAQHRGGRGRSGMTTREEDLVSHVFVASTHTPVLFFTKSGKAFQLKVYELPLASPQSRGKPIIQVLQTLEGHDRIATLLPVPEDPRAWDDFAIVFSTSKGNVRRNALVDFQNIRANGKIAMKLEEAGESLVAVRLCSPQQDVLLTTRQGRAIRFPVSGLRCFSGRSSTGVRGVRLQKNDAVVAMSILGGGGFSIDEREAYLRHISQKRRLSDDDQEEPALALCTLSEEKKQQMEEEEEFVLTVSEKGFGKRTSSYAYRRSGRGGQGVATLDVAMKTGVVVDALTVGKEDELILLTDRGQIMRCRVSQIRVSGRKTQGVTLFRLSDDETITSVVRLAQGSEGEEPGSSDLDSEESESALISADPEEKLA